jgi:hypothetical protein
MLQREIDWQIEIVKRVFGCGIEGGTFQVRYLSLSEKDQGRLKLVARRVWLTQKLRYELATYTNPVASSDEKYALNDVELPSIEVYLLCTCLDSLAGRADHVEFITWLSDKVTGESLTLSEIQRAYSQYQEEQGVGRNLRHLFETLPQVTKSWLAQNVRLAPFKRQRSLENEGHDTLMKELYRYFYHTRRNAFTHGGISRRTSVSADIIQPIEHDRWWTGGTSFSHRVGIDEATILRVIIHSTALKLLSIDPTQELMDANIKHHSRVNAAYAFLNEVDGNSLTLSYWPRLEEPRMKDYRTFLICNGIPPLESKSTQLLIERYSQNSSFEGQLREMTSHYLDQVQTMNSEMLDFTISNPFSERNSTGSWNVIKKFFDEQLSTPLYDSILNWPSKSELINLWLVIRDPCYT